VLNSLPRYPYNLAAAKQQMAESKYAHGFTETIDIDSLGNDPEVVQAIAAELQPIGIALKVTEVSEAQYSKDYTDGPASGIMYIAFYAASPDPSIFPSYLLGSTTEFNLAHYNSPQVESLMASGLATNSSGQRLSDYGQLLKNLASNVPYVVLFSGHNYTALSTKYTLPPFSVYPAFSSWALNLKPSAS
jgi:peptide/nickel transport system substrate-binding protein